jgi:CRP-like cAMP-binding protein
MKPEELERSFSRGQRILEPGSRVRELYIVRSGSVRIEWGDGRAAALRAGGAVFGETCAILGEPSPYGVSADDDAVVLVVDLPLLNRLCRESTEFSLRLIRHLAVEFSEALQPRAGDLRSDPGELGQLVTAVLQRAASGDPPQAVPGTLKELAEASRLSMLSAYRALHDLIDQGIVQLIDDQLSVVAPDALRGLLRS